MPNTITPTNDPQALVNALLAQASGITIQSAELTSTAGSANLYSGGLQGIGSGILLTSGEVPGTVNDSTSFGVDNGLAGNAALDAVVNTVFQTQSFNATQLTLTFTVTDPTATSISLDLVFGSEEYPEWVDAFVDVAMIMVNGVNIALFNHDPNHPLSVTSPNLAAGYFVDNANGALPTQYDGVSLRLKFVAPIHAGVNTVTIGIADTGDGILDSGIFLANLSAGTTPGSGVVTVPDTCTNGDDTRTGTAKDEYFDLQAGNDTAYAGAGDDIVVAGAGNDAVYGGSGADTIKGDAGDDLIDGGADSDTAVYAGAKADYDISFDAVSGKYTVTGKAGGPAATDGNDTLIGVELAKFGDGSVWSLGPNGVVSPADTGGPVMPNANQPGTLFLSGIGGQGQVLTAKVSDMDGVPAAGVTYAWQADGVDLGVSGDTFTVGGDQVGKSITVTALYTDLAGHAESLTSAAKTIAAPGNGDFAITLLNLKAPIGASVMNPLTTLVQNAIELGVSPNEAALIIKEALGINPALNLQHDDSWAQLQINPNDPAALAVEKILVQVTVMTSLGSDETGMALTQAILLAHSNHTTLDLADTDVIADLLGLDPSNSLVHEIWDRNDTIGDAHTLDAINEIWLDIQSGLSVTLSDTIGTLSVHINQAPIGTANAALVSGNEGKPYVLSAADLLHGFTDPEGGVLTVNNLAADHGIVTSGGGSFTVTPYAGYSGPIELTYSVVDNQGLSAAATQLFVVTPANQAPVLSGTVASLSAGTEDMAYTVSAADLLQGFSDANGDALSVINLSADQGTVTNNGDGTFTITPATNYVGPVSLSYQVSDGQVSVTATQSFNLVTKVNKITGDAGNNLLTGTAGADSISGLAGNDTLDGGAGADTLIGGDGSDTYYVDNTGDVVTETNASGTGGTDIVHTSLSAYTLGTNVENGLINTATAANLTGNTLNNWLNAGSGTGNNAFDGGAGTDTVSYSRATAGVSVNLALSTAQATGGSGTDTLLNIENLQGSGYNDVLTGNAGNNRLDGLAGNDTLDGKAGADTLIGGDGSDTYYVDNAGDVVTETNASATGGTDIVYTSLSAYTLGGNVENGLINTATTANLTGNTLNNWLNAGSGTGNNVFDGGTGTDTVSYSRASAGVSVSLALSAAQATGGSGADTLLNIENLQGSQFNDVLTGNAGNNRLDGLAGNDTLIGGAGADTLTGGTGNDIFDFNALSELGLGVAARDVITDFTVGQDKLDLSTIDTNTVLAGDQAFAFVTSFTTTAGQVRYSGGIVYLNTDADVDAEFEIALTGVVPASLPLFSALHFPP
ncbi:MAG: hypothetical protein RLZZ352_2356 [Pseudomonadota bacterium]